MKPLEEGKISPRQLYTLLVLSHLETTTLSLPGLPTAFAGRDGWLAALLAILAVLPLGLIAAWLGKRFPRQTIIQYNSLLLGKPFGILFSLLYIWFFVLIAALVVKESAIGFNLSVLPQTPAILLVGIMAFLSAVTARGGIEVIGRLAESSFVPVMFFTLMVLILPLNFAHFKYLQPVLADGVAPVLPAILIPLGLLGELITANMALPYLTKPGKITSILLYSVLTSGTVFLFFTIITIAVLGPTADILVLPSFKLARMITIGNFLERIEVIVLIVWMITAFIKTAFYLWIGMLGSAQLFNLKGYRELAYPLGLLIIVLGSLTYKNFAESIHLFSPQIWGTYSVSIIFGMLILLTVAALLYGKKGKDPQRNN